WSGVPARLPGHVTSQLLPDEAPRIESEVGGVNRHAVRFPLTRVYEEAAGVLKISRLSHKGRGLTIKLEGELLEPWVDSVRDACGAGARGPGPLRRDWAAVTYVDAAGVQLLRDLVAEGAEIAACSSFVGTLLHREP